MTYLNFSCKLLCRNYKVLTPLRKFQLSASNLYDVNKFYFNDLYDNNEVNFKKILIANRGEIACRVINTCRRIGIKSVAVHSDVDSLARHVQLADEAICIGPAPTAKSYLNVEAILDAIRSTGAEAVHPGYGFLSENTNFAKMLEEMGVVFLGPNSQAIRAMGDKIESKKIANKANVNCIPGFDGEISDVENAVKIANDITYPVMVKASAGGGGKGMRVAWNDKELREGYRLSKQEALASFGDDRMLVEKYIYKPRHIEMQVLCDRHGNALYLNERECSIQRRNQKVLEEAPSTFLDEKTRKAMGEQATALARAVNYDSAGTVEFLVDSNRNFYFLEMNTRLQVEHPITEAITGVDIVHQMIRIGKGFKLQYKQEDLKPKGWALESRVYAEDPYKNFGLPSIGRLMAYQEPSEAALGFEGVRCDSGIKEGSEISIYYDPMICKLVTFANTRDQCLDRMEKALDSYVIRGVTHNISLLRDIVSEKNFREGNLTTNYLQETYPEGFQGKTLEGQDKEKLAVTACLLQIKRELRFDSSPKSWIKYLSFGNTPNQTDDYFVLKVDEKDGFFHVDISHSDSAKKTAFVLPIDAVTPVNRVITLAFGASKAIKDCDILQLMSINESGRVELQFFGTSYPCYVLNKRHFELYKLMPKPKIIDTSSQIIAPMPGLVKSMNVGVGDNVSEGQEMCVLEAMKMQNSMVAGKTGKVKSVNFKAGETVNEDDVIVELV